MNEVNNNTSKGSYVQYSLTWLTNYQKYLKMNIVQEKGK